MLYIIGQIFGGIAVILGFISFQMKNAKKLLIAQAAVTAVFCIHYLLIGASTGFVMNAVGFFRNLIYYNRDKKYLSSPAVPIILSVIMGAAGIIAWEAWYSVFFVVGLVINNYCLSFKNANNIRVSILVTSPLAIVYDAFSSSFGGIIYESVAIISSVIGIIRYKQQKPDNIG